MSKYSVNVGFHGVARLIVGKASHHERHNGTFWEAVTIDMQDAEGRYVDSVTFYSTEGPLTVDTPSDPD